jgi:serine protease Do
MAMLLALFLIVCARAFAATSPVPRSGSHDRSHGYLGIEFHDTSDEQVSSLHLQGPRGAEIVMVDHDGPAGKAGLQPHDVVLQIDGRNIETAEDLHRQIRDSAPGKLISLSIVRAGRALTVTAKLANREELERNAWQQHMTVPEPSFSSDDSADPKSSSRSFTGNSPSVPSARSSGRTQSFIGTVLRTGPYTGATLESMEPQLAGFFGAPPNTGLLVHGVDANSPASFAGLRAGDVVLRMDAASVSTPSDWMKRVRAGKGRPVSLTILRDKREQTLTLMPDAKKHSLLEWPRIF